MVLIIREAFKNLSARKLRKTVLAEGIHGLAVLEQADHVMNPNTRAFHRGVAAANARPPDDVAVALGDRLHTQMVKRALGTVNQSLQSQPTMHVEACQPINDHRKGKFLFSSPSRAPSTLYQHPQPAHTAENYHPTRIMLSLAGREAKSLAARHFIFHPQETTTMPNPDNANGSTGPTSESGKFESSKNALKHGLTSDSIDRFPAEIREAFADFLTSQYQQFAPQTINERDYLEQYSFNRFQLNRAQPMLATAFNEWQSDPTSEVLEKRHARLARHVRALERSANAALAELRIFIADRLAAAEIREGLPKGVAEFTGIPLALPSHRLLDPKRGKEAIPHLRLRFVKDFCNRFEDITANEEAPVANAPIMNAVE